MSNNLNRLIYSMLTENTGRSLCDSGDAYGRNWQRNANKTLEDFEKEPEATLEISLLEYDGKIRYDFDPTISLYHKLTKTLDLDDLCDEFNAMPVDDWDSEYYGVSAAGQKWLDDHGFSVAQYSGDSFNSYNWGSILSQVIQGVVLTDDGGINKYVLLQVHGGCDVRGGYTDAKLFAFADLDAEYTLFSEQCGFTFDVLDDENNNISIDCMGDGDWIDRDGSSLDQDDLKRLGDLIGEGVYEGYLF